MTHWKTAFKSDYLSASDVDGKDLSLIIKAVKYQECVTQSGKSFCNVAIFTDTRFDNKGKCIGGTKPMILNVTNSKMVKKFSGNKTHLEEWNNIPINVYVDSNVRFGSDTVEGLRIRPTQKKVSVKLVELKESMIPNAVNLMKKGKTLSDIKTKYSLTKEVEAKLNDALDEASL